MLNKILLLIVLTALILLSVFCIRSKAPFIESDLVKQAYSRLSEKNLDWVQVSTDGRGVMLTGNAPSADMSAQAVHTVENIWGIRSVENRITLPEFVPTITPDTYDLTVTYEENKLVLTGYVPDEATRAKIVNLAAGHPHSPQIVDNLEIASGAPDGWGDSVNRLVLSRLTDYQTMTAHITGNELKIIGSATSVEARDSVHTELSQSLPGGYSLVFDVTAPEPNPQPPQRIKTAD